jgi:hypothetical protein
MSERIKRFLRFDWDRHLECGGWGDFNESFGTLEEASEQKPRDEAQIVDTETGAVYVPHWERDGRGGWRFDWRAE